MPDYRLSNKEVVQILKEALAAMEVKNYNIFKVRAYQNAISILDNLTVSIYDLWENKRLSEIPGVGPNIAQHLNELFTTGNVKEFESVQSGLPDGMFGLIGLRGIGAKKAFKLALAFKLSDRNTSVDFLKSQAEKGMVSKLEGFGEKSEKIILEAISQQKMTKNQKQRMLYAKAEEIVERIKEYMHKASYIKNIEAAGSFRRKNPTIGDLDFPISTKEPDKAIEYFLKFPEIQEVLVRGDKKASVNLKNDIQVDIRVSTPESYGAMLQYFTGSKQHNILLRNFALEKKMSLSEYGIKKKDKLIEFSTEKEFYEELGLPYIPPEIRNGSNEIEAAQKGKLPKLIQLRDIKGDVHSHTLESDGTNTLDEMVQAATELGYEYIGISDHAPSVQARGIGYVEKTVANMKNKIKEINNSQNKIKIFFGYEVNILADATLGLPDEILKELDYAVASIHSSFTQDRETVTKRLLNAIENPYINIIGHPSGRLINERDPADPDWNKIFDATRSNNKILEINSQPNRLDLTDDLIRNAIDWGVKLVVSSDAHSIDQLLFMRYGIYNAQRGWAEAKNIINTLPYGEFIKELTKRN